MQTISPLNEALISRAKEPAEEARPFRSLPSRSATKPEKSATVAILTWMRSSLWRPGVMLQGFAAILLAMYSLAATAFFVALLFYTFIARTSR